MKTYARKCSITGEGMNEGIVTRYGERLYLSDNSFLVDWIKKTFKLNGMTDEDLIDWSYAEGHHSFEKWDDHMYQEINGELIDIKL